MGFTPGPGEAITVMVPSGVRFATSPKANSVQYHEPSGPKMMSSGALHAVLGPPALQDLPALGVERQHLRTRRADHMEAPVGTEIHAVRRVQGAALRQDRHRPGGRLPAGPSRRNRRAAPRRAPRSKRGPRRAGMIRTGWSTGSTGILFSRTSLALLSDAAPWGRSARTDSAWTYKIVDARVGDTDGPTVRGSHSGVNRIVRIGEPLRSGVVQVRQRVLLERPRARGRCSAGAAGITEGPARARYRGSPPQSSISSRRPLEQVRPGVGRLDLVLDDVSQRRLDDFTRVIRFLGGPIPERRAEAVRHGGDRPRMTSRWTQLGSGQREHEDGVPGSRVCASPGADRSG